jgi:hypothetical protein
VSFPLELLERAPRNIVVIEDAIPVLLGAATRRSPAKVQQPVGGFNGRMMIIEQLTVPGWQLLAP